MNINDSIILFFTLATLAAVPGTSVALVVTRSATLGVADGIAVVSGIVIGDLVFVSLALLGLSVIANTLGNLFLTIKYLGGAYLIWTGITLWLSQSKASMTLKQRPLGSLVGSFLAGLFMTMGDVKAIVFYMSLFPLFMDTKSVDLTDIGIILTITIMAVGSVKISYAVLATKIARTHLNQTMITFARHVAAACMIGAGSFLIVTN
ncbi:MAG TPA: LysE family translocator [Gammaproteobacteria bacterium]|nr:LysE family translocator [Gammaproteobacteria bacterium]